MQMKFIILTKDSFFIGILTDIGENIEEVFGTWTFELKSLAYITWGISPLSIDYILQCFNICLSSFLTDIGTDHAAWIFHSKVHHYPAAKCTSNSGVKYSTLGDVLRYHPFLSRVFFG